MDSLRHRLEIMALCGKSIFNAHRNVGIDNALNNTLGLQFTQAIAQDTI